MNANLPAFFEPIDGLQKPMLQTHLDVVVYFIQRMDVEMLDTLLSDKYTYEGYSKEVFLYQMLQPAFEKFRIKGDEWLEVYGGHCNRKTCSYFCKGYRFRGNVSRLKLDLIIEFEANEVRDIHQCFTFQCTAAPFLNEDDSVSLFMPEKPLL